MRRLLVVLLLLALAGCTRIPASGPVVAGHPVDSDPRDGVLQVIPDSPRNGQSPDQIVTGFLRAAAGFDDDHSVARKFLAPSKRLAWSPDASVDVYPRQSSVKVTMPAADRARLAAAPKGAGERAGEPDRVTVTVRTPVVATVDANDAYAVAGPDATVTRRFRLIRSDGEWRIDTLDDGLLVSSSDFDVTFRPFPVYYGDRSGRYLVPDVHWLPGTQDASGTRELPTVLVRALLRGPAPYLRGAVSSGAPPGTRMAVAAVVVNDEVASVDLTDEVRRATPQQRLLLVSQLRATLGRLRTIANVKITVRRSDLDIPDGPSSGSGVPGEAQGTPEADPLVDPDPVVLDGDGRVARLTDRVVHPVKDVRGLAVPGANRPAVSPDGSAYAVLDAGRDQLLLQSPGAKLWRPVDGVQLTAPSFDPWGWVWTGSATGQGYVSAVRAGADAVRVRAPWLKGRELVSLRISREGARAVVALRYRGQGHVFVTGVVRQPDGHPVELTQPVGLVPDLATATDAAWVDEDEVVVLGSRGTATEDEEPWLAQVGGTVRGTDVVRGGETVTAGNGEGELLVGSAQGTLVRYGPGGWDRLDTVAYPAFAG